MCNVFRAVLTVSLFLVAALAAKAGSAMSPHPGWKNLALGKPVEFSLEPNDADVKDEGDALQLTDGVLSAADPIWYDREERLPVGWTGPNPIEFQVDLGAISPIRGVALRVGAGKSGVAWPESVKVYVSDDGQRYAPVADLMESTPDMPVPDVYSATWLEADKLKTHGRYVKFIVQPKDSGNGVYFYTDELEVYRGEDAWVNLPLPEPERKANPNSPRPKLTNLAVGMEVALNSDPNVPDVNDIDDAKQLVDGELSKGTPMWTEKSTVGWMGEKMVEFTVDLGKDQPISGVALHMAAGHAGVEWPANIELYVSQDGGDFTSLGDVMLLATEKPSEGGGYKAAWIVTEKLETHGRYVKFIISPNNQGNGSYVFLDEVEVYRGKDEWLSRPLAGVSRPEQWKADWPQLIWKIAPSLVPEGERPRPIVLIDGKTITGKDVLLQNVESTNKGVTFSLKGEAGKPRAMSWQAKLAEPISAEKCQYVLLTFKAEGIRRVYTPKALVSLQGMAREAGSNEVAILDSNTPLNDGLSHTIIRKLPEGFVLKQLALSVVTEDDFAKLTLERLEFLQDVPAIFNPTIVSGGEMPTGFTPVPLGGQANGSVAAWFQEVLSRHKAVQDGVSEVTAGVLMASGAPFLMGDPEKNLVMMPESKPSDERVSFLGQDVDKRFLEPVSRHDTLSIDVDAKAREVLLLLATASPLNQVRGGIPTRALKLDDQESLMVELTYEDGTTSLAFPYSIADRSCYIPARELNAFAVEADPSRRLRKVTLHNRHFGPAFAVAGLTLNASAEPLAPLLANIPATEPTAKNSEPADAPLEVKVEGSRLIIANKWYRYEFDLAQGFVLDRLINRWNPAANITLAKSSGLRIRMEDTIYTGRCFRAAVGKITPTEVELKLTSLRPELSLEIKVTITADDTQELRFVAQGKNLGTTPLAAELVLPAVADLSLGAVADTRAFFPQYRTVDTAEPIFLRAPYGPEYAVQFMDVYNRKLGVGLMLRTDNVTQRMMDFSIGKNADGVSAGVHFPAAYNEISPNSTHEYPKVSLFTQTGDWHDATQLYTNWVRSWYKPDRSQDKQFFLNAWDLMCYRTSNYLSWMDSRVPPFITADRTKWMTEESLAFEEKRLGHVPDFIHFFNWTYNDKKKQNEYGVFGTPLAYEQVGGLEFFKDGIANIQTKWNRPVSLYTLPDRIRISSIPDKQLAEDLVNQAWHKEIDANDQSNVVRASGSVDGIVFLQPANERWIDFFVSDLVAMQRDTGCKLVYLDVFPSFSHLKGYNGASPRDGDMVMIKRLRNELPPDVVIWTEYPLTDVASQYADGCLQYYFMDTSEVFARRYNLPDTAADLITEMPFNVQRFSTPTYKTIGLPTYIETGSKPSQVDATFFNGEAFQEDTYRLHHSRIRERLNRGYAVKKEYTDCFNSSNPQPRIYTPVGGMYVNLFPGQDRQLWTFFNGRPQTYSGTIIEVPHREGATYRDAWSGRDLKPVIENGIARIALTINPQEVGCVVQDWRAPAKDLVRAKSSMEGVVK